MRSLAAGVLLLLAATGGALVAARQARPDAGEHIDAARLKTGDLIFVRGTSWRSRVVLLYAGGREPYSHVGVVVREKEALVVVHATPTAAEAPQGAVIAEPLSRFLAQDRVTQATVYRVHASEAGVAERAAAAALHLAQRHVPFDHAFALSTPDRLYCTELVWRAYRAAGLDLGGGRWGHNDEVLTPAVVVQSPYLSPVDEP